MQRKAVFIALLALGMASDPAAAGSNTATLTVKATVETGCTISGEVLDFGTYVSGQSGDATGYATLKIRNCNGMHVTVAISGGSSQDPLNRHMTNQDGKQLAYQIYKSPGKQEPWIAPMSTPISGDPAEVPIYGAIPGGQTVPPGVYEDRLTVTVNFQ